MECCRKNEKDSYVLGLILLGFLLFASSQVYAQSPVRVDSFYMPSLGKTKEISVILPSYYNPNRRYPILYLLHGYGGG
ncbi:MAG: hypothetical protein FJ217_09090, partial [Ignavibacteria bacterium]|nr:hypothetical protein [Ignavibacteria bacterium]